MASKEKLVKKKQRLRWIDRCKIKPSRYRCVQKAPTLTTVKRFKPLEINIKTVNKKLFIKKYRLRQNYHGTKPSSTVVFKKQPLLTTCEKLQFSKNQVKNCKQKAVGLVLKTEVSGKNWQLYNFFSASFESGSVFSLTWEWDNYLFFFYLLK